MVFAAQRKRALLVWGWWGGPLAGRIDLLLLEKRNGEWVPSAWRMLQRS
jgi:hypothetical protein